MIEEEWKKTENKFSLAKFGKLYPLVPADSEPLDSMAAVDAAVTRLAKNVSLSMDSASFKDPL